MTVRVSTTGLENEGRMGTAIAEVRASRAPVPTFAMNKNERMAELGRKSGEARRARAAERRVRTVGIIAWELLNADPEPVIRRVYDSNNAVAIVEMVKLATEAKREQLGAREADIVMRDRRLREAESALVVQEQTGEWTEARLEAGRQELEEIERTRDELRALVEREASAAGLEVVEHEA